MISRWKPVFVIVVVVTTIVCIFQGYQLGGIPGAIAGAVVGVLASVVGWGAFDLRGSG